MGFILNPVSQAPARFDMRAVTARLVLWKPHPGIRVRMPRKGGQWAKRPRSG